MWYKSVPISPADVSFNYNLRKVAHWFADERNATQRCLIVIRLFGS